MKPRLSIIVPSWENAPYTIRCIRAIRQYTSANYEIVWIDNGSSRRSHEGVLRELRHKADYQKEFHPKPLGFPKAINRGIRMARGNYICFLNNDCLVMPGWDTELMAAVSRKAGCAGPVTIQPGGWQGIQNHPWLGIPKGARAPAQVHAFLRSKWRGVFIEVEERPKDKRWRPLVAFFCTIFNRDVVNKIGLLDEAFGWGFGEDVDYTLRLRKAGYKVWLCPGAVVYHYLSKTMSRVPGGVKPLYKKAGQRNLAKHGKSP